MDGLALIVRDAQTQTFFAERLSITSLHQDEVTPYGQRHRTQHPELNFDPLVEIGKGKAGRHSVHQPLQSDQNGSQQHEINPVSE
ncbi:hypothetical protein D3C81_1857430 [compost metagenome]